ncbi:MAG: class I SAM-dependent methyltransferase [Byssovorax sp.]
MSAPSDTLRTSYDAVAAAYVEHLYHELDRKPLDRHLLNRFAEEVRGPVADVGCGPGHVARYLSEQGVQAQGIDLSPEMIAWAARLNPGIPFGVGDLRALDLPDAHLAGIVAFYSLIHLDPADFPIALRELHRVLAPGGVLFLAFHIGAHTVHHDELFGQPVSLDFRFLVPAEVIASLSDAGFTVTESVEREPYPGAEHPSRRCYLFARVA